LSVDVEDEEEALFRSPLQLPESLLRGRLSRSRTWLRPPSMGPPLELFESTLRRCLSVDELLPLLPESLRTKRETPDSLRYTSLALSMLRSEIIRHI